ncbi:hypothetical protein BKA00_007587 [Actinomadura coerulea]|uniref:Uncharacterized protein n=1 Tax=Actinomadura coerulea TaxID=46159 RepID=A0A7X0G734_9ACTN|nr:hypothetical protein [Actinomadura coerulea]GGQ08947.1 hypothetical protein GCM10010187_26420 [Actinomadura coerulea]
MGRDQVVERVHVHDREPERGGLPGVPRPGQHEIAVGALGVARQLGGAPRRVQRHDHRPRQRRASEEEHHLGIVVEEDADVDRPVGTGLTGQPRGARRAFGDDLPPRPGPAVVGGPQPGAVVVRPRLQQRRDAHRPTSPLRPTAKK